jgi:hypothetical protein
MADSKKLSFSKSPILKKILIDDAKGIDVVQPIWFIDCPA